MIETVLSTLGDAETLAALGLLIGLLFGAAAQHSRFCLRAATAEVAEGRVGPRFGVWLVVFASALLLTQLAAASGLFDPRAARQIAATGSMSGAIIGGLLFGVGMVLARGCASRLLVLSGTGNMRALVAGLVLTIVAQASYRGVLAPLREGLAGLWLVEGGAARDLLARLDIGPPAAMVLGLVLLVAGLALCLRARLKRSETLAAGGVGLAVAIGWVGTYAISQVSFDPVSVSSVTFTGPSADTLMALINTSVPPLTFSLGLVPGVFVGAGLTALLTGTFALQRFDSETGLERYLGGAALVGFGSMLAGGCAVGAGVSGGAIFALTAWVAVFAMWMGALATTWLLHLRPVAQPA